MLHLFSTLRSKLFFAFLIFIFLMACVAGISIWFYQKRENLGDTLGHLEAISSKFTQALKFERDFFTYDVGETGFYQTGRSEYLARHEQQLADAQEEIKLLEKLSEPRNFQIVDDLDTVKKYLTEYEQTFKKIVSQVKMRGFKDFGLEGEMRSYAHQLEDLETDLQNEERILMLRRNEKDYMLRKDSLYVVAHQKIADELFEDFRHKPKSPKNEKVFELLTNYLITFQKLVATEKNIGYNYSLGLKKDLSRITTKSEEKIQYTIDIARKQAAELRNSFQLTFFGVLLASVIIGLVLSYVLTEQITKPIANLSQHINSLVESGFSGEVIPLPIESDDEVGKLTKNFNLMTEEIHQQLTETHKKSKVLQKQNMQLQSINLRLISSENKLRSLNSVKDKFFSIISHDLKGPLHTLTGFLQILIKYTNTFTEAELREFAASMDNSVKRLLTMLENLLQWSRSQTGNIEHKPESLHLNNVLEDNVNLFKDTARNKDISLILDADENVWVKADKNMLDFILRNLISNAIKFTRQGGEVRVITHHSFNFTEITVKDNGVGISADDMKKLFQPDIHFSTSGTGKEKGTGFGLLLCKDFIEKNGGEISIESTPGKGTSLKFTVPNTQEQPELVKKQKIT